MSHHGTASGDFGLSSHNTLFKLKKEKKKGGTMRQFCEMTNAFLRNIYLLYIPSYIYIYLLHIYLWKEVIINPPPHISANDKSIYSVNRTSVKIHNENTGLEPQT